MEILGIQTPAVPIGNRERIKVCPNCQAILSFNYEDINDKVVGKTPISYITCMSCKKDINISRVSYH